MDWMNGMHGMHTIDGMGLMDRMDVMDGMHRRVGMGWDGMGWDGMAWHGMGWDGMGWNGMDGWDSRLPCSRSIPDTQLGYSGPAQSCTAPSLPPLLPDGFAPTRSLTSLFVAARGSVAGLCPWVPSLPCARSSCSPVPLAGAYGSSLDFSSGPNLG